MNGATNISKEKQEVEIAVHKIRAWCAEILCDGKNSIKYVDPKSVLKMADKITEQTDIIFMHLSTINGNFEIKLD